MRSVAGSPPNSSTAATVGAFLTSLSAARRRDIAYGAVVTLLGTFAELLTIGSLLAFLQVLANSSSLTQVPVLSWLVATTDTDGAPVVTAAILLVGAALLAAAARLLILWTTQMIVLRLGHELSVTLFSRLLRQSYSYHALRNPSELFASVEKVQLVVYGALFPLIQGLVASVIAVAIIASLFAINPYPAFVAAAGVGLVYVIASFASRRRLKRNSTVIADTATERMKTIQEALGGIRDIILGQTHGYFEGHYNRIDRSFRVAQAMNLFISAAPRYIIEAAGIIVIGLLALYLSFQPGGLVAAIPTLGALALGAQRLLPLLQQAYLGWSNFTGNAATLWDVLELIHAPVSERCASTGQPDIVFEQDLVLQGVSLSYPERPGTLQDVNLRIVKGQKIGITGPSGSGKSSLLDVLTGLLEPSRGAIRVDGRQITSENRQAWQRHIAYVPQGVYLPDASIAHCIAFGEAGAEIDEQRVEQAARQAQLHEFIQSLPFGYATQVGERGIRLSGGQRQRIGIARALYKRASLLILDEATGALDTKTEAEIMTGLGALGGDLTLLVVSHRLSALRGCDAVVILEAGAIVSVDSFT